MYNVSNIVLCTEVTYKGYFVKQKQSKEKLLSTRPLITFIIVSDLCFIPDSATTIFILLS